MSNLRLQSLIMAAVATCALAACNVSLPNPNAQSPTPEMISTPTLTGEAPTLTATSAPSPSRTLPPVPILESPTATYTPGPPTATFTPTETPGPIEHIMRQDETLFYIIQLYGYTDVSVADQIVAMNPNVPSIDRLPGEGAVILIPRPTATPTPEGFIPSATPLSPLDRLPEETTITEHSVRSGETIVGIADQFDTTLAILDQLNPELLFLNCDFSNPSGGPGCNVPLSVDQVIKVPAPTPTPTLSPTPSGSETPTATPTYAAPMMIFPPEAAIAQGQSIRFQWVSVGMLPADYVYLIEIEDLTTPKTYFDVTRETSALVTGEIVPTDGETHSMRWRIRVGTLTENGTYRALTGDTSWRTFQWR